MAEPTHYLGSGWMVYHPKGNVMDIYEPSMVRMYDNPPLTVGRGQDLTDH